MTEMEVQVALEGRDIYLDEIADYVLGVRSGKIIGLGHALAKTNGIRISKT